MRTSQSVPDLERLGRVQRLAFSYAPANYRSDVGALFVLEAQFEDFVRQASEPVLGQMRLAWWRDRFSSSPDDWPKGNPLLTQFSGWGEAAAGLGRSVNGWENLLGERPLDRKAITEHAQARAEGWVALARHLGSLDAADAVRVAATRWALVDFAWNSADQGEREDALEQARAIDRGKRLPRPLKSLAVLDSLSRRALETSRPPLSKPSDMWRALRTGLLGG